MRSEIPNGVLFFFCISFPFADWLLSARLSSLASCRAPDPRQRQCFLRHELYCQLRLCAEEARLGPTCAGQERGQFDAASHEAKGTENRQRDFLRCVAILPPHPPPLTVSGLHFLRRTVLFWWRGHTNLEDLVWTETPEELRLLTKYPFCA